MNKERCSEVVPISFTPTLLAAADEMADTRGLSRAALVRSLVAKEAASIAPLSEEVKAAIAEAASQYAGPSVAEVVA